MIEFLLIRVFIVVCGFLGLGGFMLGVGVLLILLIGISLGEENYGFVGLFGGIDLIRWLIVILVL